MSTLRYSKMSGAGNTFIVVDGRDVPAAADLRALAGRLANDTAEHGGADGFIALYPWEGGDFEMRYYNRDGSTGMMCGNGGRCAVRFAIEHGVVAEINSITFIKPGGRYRASLTERGVRMSFPRPKLFQTAFPLHPFGAPPPRKYA